MTLNTCGYALTDKEGEMYPCERPVTGWRWYQDVGEHEDILDPACSWHENEGGRRIHEAESKLARVEALVAHWESPASKNAAEFDYGRWHRAAANALRAAVRGDL